MPALFVSLLVLLASCTGPYSNQKVSAKEQQPALKVQTERIAVTSIPEIVTANGELFAEDQATVTLKVPGRVAKLFVDLGTVVAVGQVIAELDPADQALAVKQFEAAVEQNGSNALPRNPAVPPLPTTLLSCSGRGSITNGSIGSVGGFRRMMFEPKFGKSFGLGGSS